MCSSSSSRVVAVVLFRYSFSILFGTKSLVPYTQPLERDRAFYYSQRSLGKVCACVRDSSFFFIYRGGIAVQSGKKVEKYLKSVQSFLVRLA